MKSLPGADEHGRHVQLLRGLVQFGEVLYQLAPLRFVPLEQGGLLLVLLSHPLGDRAIGVLDQLVQPGELRVELRPALLSEDVVDRLRLRVVQLPLQVVELLGERLGLLQQRLGVVAVLQKFLAEVNLLFDGADAPHGVGELRDVGRLRAFAKTYGRSGKISWSLGRQLARRLSPVAHIRDLGRTQVGLDSRVVELGQVRRKPAALLMYLVTRPGFTATREQAIEELWPDSDPASAANSLNQSLYFIRREFDPWYEDDLSVDYISFQGEVIWLDTSLVRVQSVEFVAEARSAMRAKIPADDALKIMDDYTGHFSPEFEYDEWALSWRARVHATYLQFANTSIDQFVGQGDLNTARDIALAALDRDGTCEDIERKLIWLYWQLKARSAARTLHDHLSAQERADGLDPTPLADLVEGSLPR